MAKKNKSKKGFWKTLWDSATKRLLLVYSVISILGRLFEKALEELVLDRFTSWGNIMIDRLIANIPEGSVKYFSDIILSWVFDNIFNLAATIAIIIILVIIIDSYKQTRINSKQKSTRVKEKNKNATPKDDVKPKVKRQKFSWRAYHAEYKLNANADVVNNYLLQHYTIIPIYSEHENVTYQIEGIRSIDPKESDETFQIGIIAFGTKENTGKAQKFLSGNIRPVFSIEEIPEMFFITITQGAEKVSIISFDADNKEIASYSQGLLYELEKGFSVEIIRDIDGKILPKETTSILIEAPFTFRGPAVYPFLVINRVSPKLLNCYAKLEVTEVYIKDGSAVLRPHASNLYPKKILWQSGNETAELRENDKNYLNVLELGKHNFRFLFYGDVPLKTGEFEPENLPKDQKMWLSHNFHIIDVTLYGDKANGESFEIEKEFALIFMVLDNNYTKFIKAKPLSPCAMKIKVITSHDNIEKYFEW